MANLHPGTGVPFPDDNEAPIGYLVMESDTNDVLSVGLVTRKVADRLVAENHRQVNYRGPEKDPYKAAAYKLPIYDRRSIK